MRKILTNDRSNLERSKARTSDEKRKKRSFLEKRSKEISTRRREIQIMSWLFRDNAYEDFTTKPAFSLKKLRFFAHQGTFLLFNPIFYPLVLAIFTNKWQTKISTPKIPPEKCEKFWQNQPKISYEKENSLQSRKFPSFYLDISKKVHTFASLF